ncbi:MAG TPA: transcription termination factor NusA [Candidatus Hydrothermia bacterium]|nr:transcription termination factor NusA [Candidatus Hydrothermae bacterium]MDD3649271.1 transcription termination factor NusA [Candidatus Hydrothermia bacterium]HOK22685.1 transcription termination factor NusA [Candidatus Hydrothermia bacterium]HOL23394.1 transcription termination factor NusA [Candidatus Hydrothermia bacterium]HOP32478.1 transcription termination factor NusA [Candidatus Hydrothermia bacterium]
MAVNEIDQLIQRIASERKLSKEFVVEKFKEAVVDVLKKRRGPNSSFHVLYDPKDGFSIITEKIVKENPQDPNTEISIEEATKISPDVKVDQKVEIKEDFRTIGRRYMSHISEAFLRKLTEETKKREYENLMKKIGEKIEGTVLRIERDEIVLSLGNVEASLPFSELLPGDKIQNLRNVKRLKAVILEVQDTKEKKEKKKYTSPVILSRTHPNFLKKLLEDEIPDIATGLIEIKQIARIPGRRAKVSVKPKRPESVDIGSIIGVKGQIIKSITDELGGERIDIIRYSENPYKHVANALSPAKDILCVFDDEEKYVAIVSDADLPIAKGEDAINAILASKLVGKDVLVCPLKDFERVKPAKGITILELGEEVPANIIQILRENGLYYFKDLKSLPTLSELKRIGFKEDQAIKLLEILENKIVEKEKDGK